MTQPHQPVDLHLSVHESSDPCLFMSNPDQTESGANAIDNPDRDDENFDPPRLDSLDENIPPSQVSIANLGAG